MPLLDFRIYQLFVVLKPACEKAKAEAPAAETPAEAAEAKDIDGSIFFPDFLVRNAVGGHRTRKGRSSGQARSVSDSEKKGATTVWKKK